MAISRRQLAVNVAGVASLVVVEKIGTELVSSVAV
jgi:hypothetical protein